jgi:hypothetical protein
MSVATASAVFRVRLTNTISRALPRSAAAMAQAHPTLPVPTIPIFMDPPVTRRFVEMIAGSLSAPALQNTQARSAAMTACKESVWLKLRIC